MPDQEFEVPGRPGPSIHELLERDSRPIRPVLREDRNDYVGGDHSDMDKERFLDPGFYRLEVERLWSRVWQIACREEQIPKVGDFVLYEIADKSLIIVRSAADEIKAYYNSCLHRGRMLCETEGHAPNLRCKFHGWVYSLDGKLSHVPSRWDFPQLQEREFRLPEAKVGRWGGFVFVNMDPDSISLEAYLGDIPEHAREWEFENRFLAGHVGLVIRANWKIAAEAFLESYHVMATHPQIVEWVGDANAQYTVRTDAPHCMRLIYPTGVPSPHVANRVRDEDIVRKLATDPTGTFNSISWPLPPGKNVRECMADTMRARFSAMSNGKDFSHISDSELIDGWTYVLFPNFALGGGGGFLSSCFRFRPWENDPELSLMEVMFLVPAPKDAPCPPAAKMTLLGPDQKFADALGALGGFLDQDAGNMAWVQKGLRTAKKPGLTLADYQESMIRHFHRTLDRYLAGERPR